MTEVEAIAFLIERDFGIDQYTLLSVWKVDGLLCHLEDGEDPFIVHWTEKEVEEEKSFKTSTEAAEFFLVKKKEMNL